MKVALDADGKMGRGGVRAVSETSRDFAGRQIEAGKLTIFVLGSIMYAFVRPGRVVQGKR
jgi:hypothetical protein